GFGGYADHWNERTGPYDANNTAFLEALESSNASAIFKIPGYDVSKPYPGTPMDGWTLSLTALDFSTYDYRRADDYKAMIGHSTTIKAPDSLLIANADSTKKVNVDPSWGMCMWTWSPPHHMQKELWNNPDNKPLSEDGSCEGFISNECIAALEKAGLDGFSVMLPNETRSAYGSLTTCDSFPTPDEYAGDYYNSTQDLRDYWDSYVLNFWPILTVMVNVTVDEVTPFYKRKDGIAKMSCVAPNGVGTGKGFTFSGVVPANVAARTGVDGKDGQQGKSGNGEPEGSGKDSGTGILGVGLGVMMMSIALSVLPFQV
ncbi:hypothetical protein QBC40DRAFT_147621, partial [Triangularia verruculosa]